MSETTGTKRTKAVVLDLIAAKEKHINYFVHMEEQYRKSIIILSDEVEVLMAELGKL